MKLIELAQTVMPSTLLHCTSMHNAAKIISSGTFKLAKVPRRKEYVMSTATDMSSAFIEMMYNAGSCLLTINASKFSHLHLRHYTDQDALKEIGDEKEIQIPFNQPILPIPKPLNQTILLIQMKVGKTDPSGQVHYNDQHLAQFKQLCAQHQIPLEIEQAG